MAEDAGVFLAVIPKLLINKADTFIDLAEMQVNDTEFVPLDAYKFIAMDAVEDVLFRCPDPPVYQTPAG